MKHLPAATPLSVPFRQATMRSLFIRITAAALAGAAISGCNDRLLTPDEPRSQYDRYDAVRDQRAATDYTDEFGYKQPNLRGRLLPKE
jgi:hypothetical protein